MTTAYSRKSPVRTPRTFKLMSNVTFTTSTNWHYPLSYIHHQERIKVLSWRHPYKNELTAVKIGHPLTNITWPSRGLTKKPVFFEVRRSSFHSQSEGGNKNKKLNTTNDKSNFLLSFLSLGSLRIDDFRTTTTLDCVTGLLRMLIWALAGVAPKSTPLLTAIRRRPRKSRTWD